MTVAAQVTTRVVRSFDDPSLSPAAWAALLAAGPTQGFDLTWEVQRSWWEAFGEGELLLVVASRSGEDVALAPLFSVDGMAFNIASKDRLDLLGDVADPPVLDALLETAASEVSGFVGLRLYLVPDGSPTGGRLQGAAARLGWRVFDEGSLPAPALGITADPEHAERCTRKQSLRRRERWFRDNGELVLRHLSDPEEALTHLPLFFDQHIERRATTSDPSLFLDDRSRRFYELVTRRALVAGSLRFSVLEWDGRPIVFHHGSSYEGRYLYGVPSFAVDLARHWPGEVLLRQLLLAAIAEGVDTFDFGIGDEAYKYRYATQESHLRTWGLYPA